MKHLLLSLPLLLMACSPAPDDTAGDEDRQLNQAADDLDADRPADTATPAPSDDPGHDAVREDM